jgi:hypothetical protein
MDWLVEANVSEKRDIPNFSPKRWLLPTNRQCSATEKNAIWIRFVFNDKIL